VREVEPGETGITGPAYVGKTLRKSSPIRTRSSSSCNPVLCFAFSQNSGDEPHHAGTRSGAQCSKAVITLSLEVIIWNSQFEKRFPAIMRPLARICKINPLPIQDEPERLTNSCPIQDQAERRVVASTEIGRGD
jgi:hypothetical protein